MKKYNIIYADPPWPYGRIPTGSAADHYPLMTGQEICELPIPEMAADDAALFMWSTWPMLPLSLEVIEDWGFTYKTAAFVWVKTYNSGLPVCGIGRWTRGSTEHCLLATRGSPKRLDANVPQVVLLARREHSAKPPEVRGRIVQLMGDLPRIELFARRPEPSLFGDTMAGRDTIGYDISGKPIEQELEELINA